MPFFTLNFRALSMDQKLVESRTFMRQLTVAGLQVR